MSKTAQEIIKIFESKLFELSPELIMFVDTKGKILKINKKVVEWMGYSRKEFTGKSIFQMPFIDKKGKALIVKNFALRMLGKGKPPYEIELVTKSGKVGVGRVSGTLIKDEKGKAIGDLVIMMNVTDKRKVERELWSVSEQMRAVISNVKPILFVVDREGKFLLSEGHDLKSLGLKPGQVVGQSALKMYRNSPKIVEALNKAFKGKTASLEFEVEVNKKTVIFDGFFAPYKNEQSEIVGCLGMASDVTERRNEEKRLERVEQQLRVIIEHSEEVYYVNSVEYDKLEYVSPQCESMMGYTAEELMKNWTLVLSDSPVNKKVIESTKKAIESGEKQSMYIMEIKRKDGKIITTEVDETPIKNAQGKVIGLSGVVRDVTKRREIESKLQNRVEQLEDMNEVVVGRELKMVELKKKISDQNAVISVQKNKLEKMK